MIYIYILYIFYIYIYKYIIMYMLLIYIYIYINIYCELYVNYKTWKAYTMTNVEMTFHLYNGPR